MTIAKPFAGSGGNMTGLCVDVFPVTASDSEDLTTDGGACFITCKGSAGNVAIVTAAGNERTYPIAVGEKLEVGVTRVKSTGTTATTIWAFRP